MSRLEIDRSPAECIRRSRESMKQNVSPIFGDVEILCAAVEEQAAAIQVLVAATVKQRELLEQAARASEFAMAEIERVIEMRKTGNTHGVKLLEESGYSEAAQLLRAWIIGSAVAQDEAGVLKALEEK